MRCKMEKAIIVRYGEIGIKSYWVRREFEKRLTDNICRALLENKIEIQRIKQRGARVYIWCKQFKKALKVLRNVFGIVSYSPAYVIKTDLNEIKKLALRIYKKSKKKKFRITTRRRFKGFPLTSMQISADIGAYVVEKAKGKVDLENYDININIELNKKQTFVFSEIYKAWGGLPIGTQGKVFCYVSNKRDFVCAFLMARRGCEVILGGSAKVKKFARRFEKKFYFYEEPLYFIEIDKNIKKIENEAKKFGAKAIVFSKVNLKERSDLPIFYPLLGFSEKQIKKILKEMSLD